MIYQEFQGTSVEDALEDESFCLDSAFLEIRIKLHFDSQNPARVLFVRIPYCRPGDCQRHIPLVKIIKTQNVVMSFGSCTASLCCRKLTSFSTLFVE